LRAQVVAVLDETLTRVTRPILAFDAIVDVIVGPDAAWALDQRAYERLFRDSEAVLARTREWVDQLGRVLPLADESREFLAERLRSNSVLRRKIHSVLRKPYLPSLTLADIAAKAAAHHLNPSALIHNGQLVITRENENDLLHLLNEDLFVGDFSHGEYAASRKALRGSPESGRGTH
jgi:hypothetical protein